MKLKILFIRYLCRRLYVAFRDLDVVRLWQYVHHPAFSEPEPIWDEAFAQRIAFSLKDDIEMSLNT